MLCVFGFAASAFAMHADIPSETTAAIAEGSTQITISGQIRVQYEWDHVGFNTGGTQPENAFFAERVRLGVDAKLTPNTEGFIQLSSEGDLSNSNPDYVIGGAAFGPINGYSTGYGADQSYGRNGVIGNELKGGVSIRNMWILYHGTGLLGEESGIKIGHMPMSLGSGLFFDHTYFGDDGAVLYTMPTKELEIAAVINVASESFLGLTPGVAAWNINGSNSPMSLSDKATGYVLLANYKPSKTTGISADITYFDVQNIGETAQNVTIAGNSDDHLWNFGLRGHTEVGGLRLKIDGEIQTGTIGAGTLTYLANPTNPVYATTKEDYEGFAVQAGAGYTIDPVKLDLEFGYGSGDNGKDPSKDKTFTTAEGPESTFADPYRYSGIEGETEIQGPYAYNYRTVNGAGNQFGGLANTWYLRLGGNTDLTKDVNLDLAVFYLQAPEAITTSNAGLYGFSTSNVAAKGYTASHDIGTELDGRLTYKIDKGLITWVEGGYLWAGDFWKAMGTVAPGSSPSDVYTARAGIQLSF